MKLTLPIIEQLKGRSASDLRFDVMAGLTVAVMLIPQGMAYAMLAGLPPIYGLYAGFIPLIIYPLIGSSRQLSVGPVALVSIIVLAGLQKIAPPGSPEFIQLALLTALVAGIIQVILALFRLGFLVNFLSEPVIAGFTFAAAIIIALSQMKYILGVEIGTQVSAIGITEALISKIGETNWPSLGLGISGLALIIVLKKIWKHIPAALIAIIIGTILVYSLKWFDAGVDIVGRVPKGLPVFDFSFIDFSHIGPVFSLAVIICLISFIESLAIAKTIAAKHGNYPIDANQELLGLGLAKIGGAFFQAFPNTGSFSRSAINDDAGARSGLASIFAAIFIGILLLFLTPLLFYLPKPILAAIVISAVYKLIDIPYTRRLFKMHRKDFYVLIATFSLTLLLGVQQGVFVGIIFSLMLIIYKTSRPHFAVLGKLEGLDTYRNVERYPNADVLPGILIVRYDDDLYFGNAEHFYDAVMEAVRDEPGTHTLIVHMPAITDIDSTGLHKFELLLDALEKQQIRMVLAGVRGPVRDILFRSKISNKIGDNNFYLTVQDAIAGLSSQGDEFKLSRKYASQYNQKK